MHGDIYGILMERYWLVKTEILPKKSVPVPLWGTVSERDRRKWRTRKKWHFNIRAEECITML